MYNRPRIGEILIDMAVIGSNELEAALETQKSRAIRVGELLVEAKACTPIDIVKALSKQLDIDLIEEISVEKVDLDLLEFVPLTYARTHHILPFYRNGNTVIVAVADPLDFDALDQVAEALRSEIEPVIAVSQLLTDAINAAYDLHDRQRRTYGSDLKDEDDDSEGEDFAEIQDLILSGDDDEAPVINFVNTTFVRAARDQASDIHIEPQDKNVIVRFRVDGVLQHVAEVPKRFHSSIAARIKIMSALNIAEKRLPQDGRIRIKLAGKDIDIRVATIPTTHGERITMRLLDTSDLIDLGSIGMFPATLQRVEALIQRPYGIILVTGPTGSGKTTTLYSCLSRINKPDKNILTCEDPVEYQLNGISQVAVNPKINLTFASGLRSFLRHDPDIIMVGEIRDEETAGIAIQASLTGHLVLSTLHTNDAAGAFTRLTDMGVEPFLVASSLLANLAQRLVRRLCKHCKEAFYPSEAEITKLGVTKTDVINHGGYLYKPVGCDECRHSGYRGRTGIYELLMVTDEIRQLVMGRSDASVVKKQAVQQGMRTLQQDGASKVLQGVTSIEEVFRVTQSEVTD